MCINLKTLRTHIENCVFRMRLQRILQQSVKQERNDKLTKTAVSRDVTPQPTLDLYRHFSRHCTHVTQEHSSTLMIGPVGSSETSVHIYQGTRRHLPEYSLQGHHNEHFKFQYDLQRKIQSVNYRIPRSLDSHTNQYTSGFMPLLGAFAKLRKATITFAISVCTHGIKSAPPLGGFSLNLVSGCVSKLCSEN